jgi:hypothetical protein
MKILDRLPITEARTPVRFGDRSVTALPDQILVWVSVDLTGTLRPEKNIPKFPTLLDSGNNSNFAIQHRHLRQWAGIDPAALRLLGSGDIAEQPIEWHEATLWLYPNVPGTRDIDPEKPPLLLEMERGIAVYPHDADPPGPRLPLLGLRAVLKNDLDWWLDPERRQITVQTRNWRRHLMRLLCRI